ncbi:MAG: translocation/assembly module TamB domain-containing protein [Spirochaetales bacterium]|nr:translocation/assembly module TamB domain-containing protein [Spirochaetales bacterium]
MRFVPARGGLPRRRLAAVAALILSGALAALSGPPLAALAERSSALYLEKALSDFGEPLGLELSYESASPSVLGTLTVRGLEARRPGDAPLLSAEKASIVFDGIALVSGGSGNALERVELSGVRLDLDLERDAPLLERMAELAGRGRRTDARTERLEISARRFSVNIVDGKGGSWFLDGRSAEAALDAGRVDAALSGRLGASSPALGALSGSSAAFSVSGRSDASFTTGRWEAEISVDTPIGMLEAQRFALLLRGGSIEARRLRDDIPLDLTLLLAPDRSFRASARFERFTPRRSFVPRAFPADLVPWLGGTYDGDASFEFGAGFSEPRFSVRIAGGAPASIAGAGVRFSVDASGGPESLTVRSLSVSAPDFNAAVSGTVLPGTLGLDLEAEVELGMRNAVPVKATVRALGASGAYFALADGISVGGVTLGTLVAKADVVGETALFRASLDLPVGAAPVDSELAGDGDPAISRLEIEGSLNLGAAPYLEAGASLGRLEARAFGPLLEGLAGSSVALLPDDLVLSLGVALATDFKRLSWSTGDFVAVAPSIDFSARLAAAGGLEHVELRSSELSFAGYQASGTGRFDFPARGDPTFAADFILEEIPYAFEGALADGSLDLRGDYGLSLSVRNGPLGAETSVSVEAMPLPLPFGTGLLALEAEGVWTGPGDWSLMVERLTFDPADFESRFVPTIACTAFVDQDGAAIRDLEVSDAVSSLEGEALLSWTFGRDPSVALALELSGADAERYRLDGSWDGKVLGAALEFEASPLSRVPSAGLRGGASGRASVAGTPDRLAVNAFVSVPDGLYGDRDFSVDARISWLDGILEISEAKGRYAGNRFDRIVARLDLGRGGAELRADWTAARGSGASIELAADAVTPGDSLFEDPVAVRGSLSGLRIGNLEVDRWGFSGARDGDGWAFSGEREDISVRILGDGAFSVTARAPLPLRFTALGRLDDSGLVLNLDDLEGEIEPLVSIVPLPVVELLGGTFSGRLRIEGPATDPDFTGSLLVSGLEVRVPDYTPETIGPVSGVLDFDGRRASFMQPRTPAGSALMYVSLSALMSGWLPTELAIRAATIEKTQVPIDTYIAGIAAEGAGELDLDIRVGQGAVEISGRIDVPAAEVVLDPSLVSGGKDGAGGDVALVANLDIRLGKGVRVYFPSKNLPIITGQADPSSALSISVDTAASRLRIKGTVELRGGNLFYIQRNFFLKKASIVFNETETNFDPLATLEAELRTSDALGPVRVTLRAENTRLTVLDITMESSPPRSSEEIAALLGLGLVGSEGGGEFDVRKAVIAGTQAIPQLNFVTLFEENVRKLLGFDLFYLRTEAVQRLLLDLSLPDPAETQSSSLASLLDGTAVFAGKYIGEKVFFDAALSLQVEPLAGRDVLTVDSGFGLEWDTPFFLLDWRLSPKHPEDLFLSDNSFTFSWRLSF